MKTVPEKCKKHPTYKVLRQPRASCEDCWRMWIDKQDRTPELKPIAFSDTVPVLVQRINELVTRENARNADR